MSSHPSTRRRAVSALAAACLLGAAWLLLS